MKEEEYKCANCGAPASIAEEYATFASSYGCTGSEFRFYCKDCFIDRVDFYEHNSMKCNYCGKELDNKKFYSFYDELYCSLECFLKAAPDCSFIEDV